MRWFLQLFSRPSLISLFNTKRKTTKLSTLYAVEVRGSLSPEQWIAMQGKLDVYADKYGIGFIIVQDGVRIKRFDEY
jgi:hypothetical protein